MCFYCHQRKPLMQVVSEYFLKKGMDDSLSDFQEKKKLHTGPKNVVKTRVNKKKLKRVKGQKDIRKLIKGKESELVSYSKDFDQICKNSGVDVDSEQLQLAIALSKSLQDVPSPCASDNSEEKPLTSQEKTKKIRITLQEYGFKASKTVTQKKIGKRKFRKQYKLLLVSEESRQQLILHRYSEVLATNIHKSPKKNVLSTNNKSELYYKATEACYESMKSNICFYVKDLCLETRCSISLLRNWSDIPGRPLSPKVKINDYNFDNSNHTQEELDFILSGSIHTAQGIIKNKYQDNQILSKMGVEDIKVCINEEKVNIKENTHNIILSIPEEESNKTSLDSLSVTQKVRSVSPDLFEDESTLNNTSIVLSQEMIKKDNQTIFMDLTECVNFGNDCTTLYKTKQSSQDTEITKRKSNDFMEITNCVPSTSNQCPIVEIDLTQGFIAKTNERTNSIIETSNIDKDNMETMDLTQSSNSEEDALVEVNSTNDNDSLEDTIIVDDYIDFNSKSKGKNFSIYNEDINTSSQKEIDILCDNVDLQDNLCIENEQFNKDDGIGLANNDYSYTDHVFDHSHNYNYVDGDNLVYNVDESKTNVDKYTKDSENKLDETGHNNSISHTSLSHTDSYSSICDIKSIQKQEFNITQRDDSLNISGIIHANIEKLSNNHKTDKYDIENPENDSAYNSIKFEKEKPQEEIHNVNKNYIKNISESLNNSECLRSSDICADKEHAIIKTNANNSNEINNLSPAYDYNDYVFEHSYVFNHEDANDHDCHEISHSKDQTKDVPNIDLSQDSDSNSLKDNNETSLTNFGNTDDVSIDYDEIIETDNRNTSKSTGYEVDNPNSSHKNNISTHTTPSKNSEAFNISDKEFNYSVNRSIIDDFDHDGFADIGKVSGKNANFSRSMSENDINIVNNQDLQSNTATKALSQEIRRKINKTPKNDFVIKTNDVTPMADYASMSSPERNRELDKYGLKPFKRKRAIQLLTYLYNQTHPVVASCDLECQSPSKRPKLNSPKKSPKKSRSPRNSKEIVENKENNIYNETKLVPDIRDVTCEPEDWIFQTREKAKIHSCRVPLHIAFHNYVSCRQYLRESILRYEPVNIDVIHKQLLANGYRYNPKDLLKFMDKKCITVKTADNSAGHRK